MAVAHLSIQGLSKSYGQHQALCDVDLTAYSGEVLAVLGKNGAGKTSLINSVLGMHSYRADQLELLGQPMLTQQRSLEVRQRLGVMMQLGALAANLTVYEQLDLFCSYYQNGFQVTELIEKFNLNSIAKQRFGDSGGQRQQSFSPSRWLVSPTYCFLTNLPWAWMSRRVMRFGNIFRTTAQRAQPLY